jgi:hypothetical protein
MPGNPTGFPPDARKGITIEGNVAKGVALEEKILNNPTGLLPLKGRDYH